MISLLYVLFFLSGAAGLMYESVWARYLGLFVGHEAYAQVLVLAIYLGGMSLGAYLVSRRADGFIRPLQSYASIELAVGAIGLLFHPLFVWTTDWAYAHAFPAAGIGLGSDLVKWVLAALLILPQSVLLGTTFPLMSAGVLRLVRGEPGKVLSWLYFTNSLGASLGVVIAGFGVVAWWGLPGVLHTAAALNLLVGAAAGAVSWGTVPSPPHSEPQPAVSPPGELVPEPRLSRLLLAATFLTAVASFCYEIDWIRMLSLVLGSATHSFELMLSAFILGLALGAFWIKRRLDRLRDPMSTLARIQVAMGVLAVATLPVYLVSFAWMEWLLEALGSTGPGYVLFTVIRYGFCLAVMLPATFCAGMTLPLITRVLLTQERTEAAVGRVYAVNTLGSIVGAVLAALVLLPWLGLKGLLVLAALLDIGVGALIVLSQRPRRVRGAVPAFAAGIAVLLLLSYPVHRLRLVSGVFRGFGVGDAEKKHLDYYADGRTATVSVIRGLDGFMALATNGKTDASLSAAAQRRCDPLSPPRQVAGDEVTQLLTAIVPLGYVGKQADAAVVGIGSGISTHTLLASPDVRSVTTIEIEPRMVDGARLFFPANRRTFDDSRSRIVIGDARAVFAASGHRFDLIVSEPSNPWVSGVSSLFTEEYYRRVLAQLAPSGVFAQWLQTYELDDASVLRVLRAIDAVFPEWEVHQAGLDDILIIATPAPKLPPPHWDAVVALPAVQADLCGVFPLGAAALDATLLADRGLLGAAVRRIGAPNSDYHPLLDLEAERRRFEGHDVDALLALGDRWLNYARQLMNRRELPVPVPHVALAGMRRSIEQQTQTWQTAEPGDSAPTPTLGRIRYEWLRWQRGMLEADPPSDWRSWVAEFQSVGRFRHAGTAGWFDDRFFQEAMRFATGHRAPDVVLEVIRFRRATQGWLSAEALAAAERLGARQADLAEWIPIRDLLDGAVISAIALGRPRVAKVWMARFGGEAGRNGGDVISQILAGLLQAPSGTITP